MTVLHRAVHPRQFVQHTFQRPFLHLAIVHRSSLASSMLAIILLFNFETYSCQSQFRYTCFTSLNSSSPALDSSHPTSLDSRIADMSLYPIVVCCRNQRSHARMGIETIDQSE